MNWTVEPGEFEVMIGASSQDIRPVSYTHLDVYKRQHQLVHNGIDGEACGRMYLQLACNVAAVGDDGMDKMCIRDRLWHLQCFRV